MQSPPERLGYPSEHLQLTVHLRARPRHRDREGPSMAKALLGHLGGPDPVVMAELARLRRRARDLEDEVVRLHAENEALTALVADEQMLSLAGDREPALT
jgi:hypothetical protein